jgi:hypothetical protein
VVGTWDELRITLRQLEREDPGPLRSFPTPSVGSLSGPFRISLAAWAVDIAADLHARFGADVVLTVGYLHYPSQTLRRADGSVFELPPPPEAPLLVPEEVEVTLAEAVEVRSGYDVTANLLIWNKSIANLDIYNPIARVIDPRTLAVVGMYAGPQPAVGVRFTLDVGDKKALPLLVGTASLEPSLGYAVPSGEWALDTILPLGRDGMRRTPPLPLTVTV